MKFGVPSFNFQERRNGAVINMADSVMWGATLVALATLGNVVVDEFKDGWTFDMSDLEQNTVGFVENHASWQNAFFALLLGSMIEGWTHYKKHETGGGHGGH
jgi:hypothetical protein